MTAKWNRSLAWGACMFAIVMGLSACSRTAPREAAAPTPPSPSSITGSAGHIHVDDGGAGGVPVVFVHSFAGSGAHWAGQLAHLRPTRRAVALDLRGHGQSTPPATGVYEVDSLAGDIAAVVDGLGLDRFVLVGHSMGGAAAIAYAGAHPDRVAGLVMVGTPGQSPPEQAKQVMAAMESDYEKTSGDYWKRLLTGARPEVEAQVRGDMARVPREAGMAMIRAIFEYDPLPALQRVLRSQADRGHFPRRLTRSAVSPGPRDPAQGDDRHQSLAAAGPARGVQSHPGRVPRHHQLIGVSGTAS